MNNFQVNLPQDKLDLLDSYSFKRWGMCESFSLSLAHQLRTEFNKILVCQVWGGHTFNILNDKYLCDITTGVLFNCSLQYYKKFKPKPIYEFLSYNSELYDQYWGEQSPWYTEDNFDVTLLEVKKLISIPIDGFTK